MERKGEFDYDMVMTYYQFLLKKEKEAFEGEKQKKLKDVEFWARAVREEERVATEKYAKEHGEAEMKQIQRAVKERHEKELKMKQALACAYGSFARFKADTMARRRIEHENKMLEFIDKKGSEIQTKIIDEAKAELRKMENIRKVKEAEEKRKKQDIEKDKKLRAEGRFEELDESTEGWSKGVTKQPAMNGESSTRKDDTTADVVMTRSGFGQSKAAPTEDKKADEGFKRPSFIKQAKKDEPDSGVPMSRTQMAAAPAKKEEEKKEPAGPWRSTGA